MPINLRSALRKISSAVLSPSESKEKEDEKKEIPFSIFETEEKIKQRKKRIREEMPED